MPIGLFTMRLPVSWPLAGLALAFAVAPAFWSKSTCAQSADVEVTAPARQTGAGFEFRRRPSVIDNPYCSITTYVVPDFPEQASSAEDADDRAVIVIDSGRLKADRAYAHFLMAHECCHHTLGHTRLTSQKVGNLGPQPFYYLQPLLKNMELEADACAVRMLKRTNALDAIESARKAMLEFGTTTTGAYYPTGVERADNITHAAAGD